MEVNILKKLRSACDLVVDQNMEASQIAISVQTKLESKIHEKVWFYSVFKLLRKSLVVKENIFE